MKMKLSRKVLFLPLLLACFPLAASTQDKSLPEVYSAVAIGTGGSVGAKTMNFDVRVTSYTTDDEVQKFAELLKAKGQDALVSALQDENKGRVSPVGSTGNQIAVARKRTADGITTITIVTTRLMSFQELYHNGRSTDYPFTFVQFKLNAKGEGTGQIMVAAKIKFDKKQGQYVIESFGNQYIKAANVRLSQ
jgi:hypothetical protein